MQDEPTEITERVKVLANALSDSHISVKWNAARDLAKIGPGAAAALPALRVALADRDATTALWARYAIVMIMGETSANLTVFIEALQDGRIFPGMAAAALAGLGPEASAATPLLITELSSPVPDRRWSAAGALARIGPKAHEASSALAGALSDEDEKVRWYAAWALGQIGAGGGDVVSALIRALDDVDDDVRGYAAQALGLIAASEALPHLESLRDIDNEAVRREVRTAIERIQPGR